MCSLTISIGRLFGVFRQPGCVTRGGSGWAVRRLNPRWRRGGQQSCLSVFHYGLLPYLCPGPGGRGRVGGGPSVFRALSTRLE